MKTIILKCFVKDIIHSNDSNDANDSLEKVSNEANSNEEN